jgi:hypothetical protein
MQVVCESVKSIRSEEKMTLSETYFAHRGESFYTSALRFIDASQLFV